jgi:hypothetical protein
MAHKIKLTGQATSELREFGDGHSFDLVTTGSPAAPKGLPVSTEISYTVFVNMKQLKKAGLSKDNLKTEKLLIEGEPVLDVPIDQCPGEIGVVCFMLQVIQPKTNKDDKKEINKKDKEENTVYIPIEDIVISKDFQARPPRPEKIFDKIDIINKNDQKLIKPIIIHPKSQELIDGYAWYLAAKELEIKEVPVLFKENK